MGGSYSKPKEPRKSFTDTVKDRVEQEITRRTMLQREIQMAVSIAKARDTIFVFGSVWLTFVSAVTVAKVMKKPVPPMVGVPVVVGAVVLGNIADMAYGNKLQRVNKEAAFILDHERVRFVPFPQAPFAKLYTAEERFVMYDQATAVGDLGLYKFIGRSFVPARAPATKMKDTK